MKVEKSTDGGHRGQRRRFWRSRGLVRRHMFARSRRPYQKLRSAPPMHTSQIRLQRAHPFGLAQFKWAGLHAWYMASTYHVSRLISKGAIGARRKVAQIAIFPCRWARCEDLRRLREKSSLKQIVRNFQQTFRQVLRRVEDR